MSTHPKIMTRGHWLWSRVEEIEKLNTKLRIARPSLTGEWGVPYVGMATLPASHDGLQEGEGLGLVTVDKRYKPSNELGGCESPPHRICKKCHP